MALPDQSRQRLPWPVFAVNQDYLRFARRDGTKPFKPPPGDPNYLPITQITQIHPKGVCP